MDLRLLGPTELLIGDVRQPVGGPRQRAVLTVLALNAGRPVRASQLVDDLWGESSPVSATHTVEAYVSRLRRVLNLPGEPAVLLTTAAGYELTVGPAQLDVLRFAQLAGDGRAALGRDDVHNAETLLAAALAFWRGPALADVRDAAFAPAAAERLDNDRLAALESLFDARLRLDRHVELVSELEQVLADHPFRERFHAQLMTALYRSGRQADALAAYQRARRVLVARRGIEPGPELRALEQAILVQAPELQPARQAVTFEAHSAAAAPPPMASPPADDMTGVDAGAAKGRFRIWASRPARTWSAVAVAVILIAAVGLPRFLRMVPHRAAVAPVGVSEIVGNGIVTASLSLPGEPGGAVAGDGSLWVTSPEVHALYRIDPATHDRQATIGVGAGAGAVAVARSDVWVANSLDGTLSRVDATSNTVVQTVAVGSEPTGLAVGDGRVWVADETTSTVTAVDAATGRVVSTQALSAPPFGVAFGAGAVWLTSSADDNVTRVGVGGGPGVQIPVGSGPTAVAFGLGSVWVANSLDSTVSRIDPTTDSVLATVPVGDGPDALAIAGNTVWVGNRLSSTLTRIDARTDSTSRSVSLGASPVALAATAGAGAGIWTATRTAVAAVSTGGTLRVLSSDLYTSIDPAFSQPNTPAQFGDGTYDTLLTFQRVGGSSGLQIVPDLALTMPTVTAGGTAYSFTLRPGLRYSNGRPVRPEDFRYAIERVMYLNSYGLSTFSSIAGAPGCHVGKPCDLSQGISVSDAADAVTFHLSAPDPDFLNELTDLMSAPVPTGEPMRDIGLDPVPSTGPYMIDRYVPAKEVDFDRNPYFREWSAAAEPAGSPDRIDWTFGQPIPQEVSEIETGRADWTPDLIPGIAGVLARFPHQLHLNPASGWEYAAFNTRAAPFDDVRVRQAFSLAADRRTLVASLGGPRFASPACQILPPGILGHRPYCPFTTDPSPGGAWVGPDVAAARKLVAESGTSGMRVTVLVQNDSADEQIGAFTVSVLRELGYRTSLTAEPWAEFLPRINDSREAIQATASSYYTSYPADILDFFRCSSFKLADPADTSNGSFFCNPAVDRLIATAGQEEDTDPAQAASTWAAADHAVTDEAPWVPLASPNWADLLSSRITNYQYNPAFGVVLDQLTVHAT